MVGRWWYDIIFNIASAADERREERTERNEFVVCDIYNTFLGFKRRTKVHQWKGYTHCLLFHISKV